MHRAVQYRNEQKCRCLKQPVRKSGLRTLHYRTEITDAGGIAIDAVL
jgi:hypothetical protein